MTHARTTDADDLQSQIHTPVTDQHLRAETRAVPEQQARCGRFVRAALRHDPTKCHVILCEVGRRLSAERVQSEVHARGALESNVIAVTFRQETMRPGDIEDRGHRWYRREWQAPRRAYPPSQPHCGIAGLVANSPAHADSVWGTSRARSAR